MHLHRALHISEVLDLVFDELADDRQALAHAAQCCRLFSSPALDVLWRAPDSSEPLEKLLPGGITIKNDSCPYTNDICSHDWTRFDMYANRIRSDPCGTLSPLYCMFSRVRPGVIPFPHLRDMKLSDYRAQQKILVLFPPRLRRLSVEFHQANHSPLRPSDVHLCMASRQVSGLQRLDLIGNVSPTSLVCINEFRNLRTLDLRNVSRDSGGSEHSLSWASPPPGDRTFRDLILSISELKNLVKLRFPRVHGGGLRYSDIPDVPRAGFRVLEVIAISARPRVVVKFLTTFSPKGLRDIALSDMFSTKQSTYWELAELFEKIRMTCRTSLRSFDISEGVSNEGLAPREFLAPLLDLALLENLSMARPSIVMSLEHVQEMATAWPNLRNLKLLVRLIDISPDCSTPSSAFQSLLSLATRCPKLVNLHVIIDSIDVPDAASWPVLSHGLEVLNIELVKREFLYSFKLPLARLLDRVFPTLRYVFVQYDGEFPDVYVDENGDPQLEPYHWNDIWGAIRMFQEVRSEHRQ